MTEKKRPNCADGTCPPKRAVHAKGCPRRAAQIAAEDQKMYRKPYELLRLGGHGEHDEMPPETAKKVDDFLTDPSTGGSRVRTNWRNDTKEAFDQRLKLAWEMQAEELAKPSAHRPWWKFWGRRA